LKDKVAQFGSSIIPDVVASTLNLAAIVAPARRVKGNETEQHQ
jgi:hypothetical protein